MSNEPMLFHQLAMVEPALDTPAITVRPTRPRIRAYSTVSAPWSSVTNREMRRMVVVSCIATKRSLQRAGARLKHTSARPGRGMFARERRLGHTARLTAHQHAKLMPPASNGRASRGQACDG